MNIMQRIAGVAGSIAVAMDIIRFIEVSNFGIVADLLLAIAAFGWGIFAINFIFLKRI